MNSYFKEERKLKKIVAFILCAVMVLSINLNTFAAEKSELKELQERVSKNVTTTYTETSKPDEVYCLNIEWNGLSAEYTTGGMTWNPDNLQYEGEEKEGSWESGIYVILTNKSNMDIQADVTFAPKYEGIVMDWSDYYEMDMGAAIVQEEENVAVVYMVNMTNENYESKESAPTITLKGTLSGNLTTAIQGEDIDTTNAFDIGTVTVQIY